MWLATGPVLTGQERVLVDQVVDLPYRETAVAAAAAASAVGPDAGFDAVDIDQGGYFALALESGVAVEAAFVVSAAFAAGAFDANCP